MASFSSPVFSLVFPLLASLCCLSSCSIDTVHHVDPRSLLPSQTCSSFKDISASFEEGGYLRVADIHGPCSPLVGHKKPISHEQILDQDEARVNFLHRRASTSTSASISSNLFSLDPNAISASTIPARSGTYLSTGNYVVTVSFGTPEKAQTIVFDTGSDVTWIQCQPCARSCYRQQDPLFDPSQSSTYANISCTSAFCSELSTSGCTSSTCLYGVQYGDSSTTSGFYAEDTLALSPSDVIPRFRFGCGERNMGLFGETAGLMGLGRGKPSLVSQTSQRYGGVFAYCLPSTSSKTGYLTFGKYPASSSSLQFTPILSRMSEPTFYYVKLTAISIGGQQLPVPATVFTMGGTILDSGTVITRLPPTAYSALRSAFRQAMERYRMAPPVGILDTCYDLTGESNVTIPMVELNFDDKVKLKLIKEGTLYGENLSQLCLAFAANRADSDLGIVGNVQQRGYNVVYNLREEAIGFGIGEC